MLGGMNQPIAHGGRQKPCLHNESANRACVRSDDERGGCAPPEETLTIANAASGAFQSAFSFEREVEETLVRRLREGWNTKSLLVPGEVPVFLSETVTPTIQPVANEWACSLGALEISARGPSPVAAYQAAVRALRAEVQRLLCAYAHEMKEDDRRLKQRLLRTVDIVASRLDADAPTTTWVFGDLIRREDQTLWLKTCGTFERWFPIPDQLVKRQQLWPDNSSHFARVQAGRSGEPLGPVIEVEGAFRRPELLLAWKKRLRDE